MSDDDSGNRAYQKEGDIGKGGKDSERRAPIVLSNPFDGLNTKGRKDQRETKAGNRRPGKRHPWICREPEEQQAEGFDEHRADGGEKSAVGSDE